MAEVDDDSLDSVDLFEKPDPAKKPEAEPEPEKEAEPEQVVEPVVPAEPKPEHNFDKGLQKLQMELASERRRREEFETKVLEHFKPQAPPDELEKVVKSEVDYDQAIKLTAGRVQEFEKKLGDTSRTYEARMSALEDANNRLAERAQRAEFAKLHPELESDYQTLAQEAQAEFEKVPQEYRNAYVWGQVAEQVIGRAKVAKAAKPVVKPSTKPDKDTSGTRISPSAAAGKQKPSKDSDEDIYTIDLYQKD